MTKTFICIGSKKENGEFNIGSARCLLIGDFETFIRMIAISKKEFRNINSIQLTFREYEIDDYPDQKAAVDFIRKEYTNKNKEIYWCGTKYATAEQLLSELKEQKFLAELVINY